MGAPVLLLVFASAAAAFLRPPAVALVSPRPAAARFARTACISAAADGASDYYSVLGLQPDASQAEVKRAYRRAALRSHPDVNKAADAQAVFARVAEAYSVLSDPEQRSKYDRQRRSGSWSGYGSSAGQPRGTSRGGAAPGGGGSSSAWGAEWEARRRAEDAKYDAGGDTFGDLFGDLLSALGDGGVGGWVSLLEELSPMDAGEMREMLRSTDVQALRDELKSARFVQQTLRDRVLNLAAEVKKADTEAASWAAQGGGGMARDMERALRREAVARRSALDSSNTLLARAVDREAKIAARIEQLQGGARGGAAPGGGWAGGGAGGAYRSGKPGGGVGGGGGRGSRRLGSVEEELQLLKKKMGK